MKNVWLPRYTKILVGAAFFLIIAGGLVTSTKSGLSVPDWPLSYGKWMPPMVGGIRYEHTHRMIASFVGLMTLVLAFWLGVSEKRTWVRWTGIAALGMVVAQGILGGMTVLYLLPAPISIVHACLAQTFFALVVSLAFFTSREWTEMKGGVTVSARLKPGTDSNASLTLLLIALVYVQLILGATLRHTENRLIVISHVTSGFLVLIHSIFVMIRILKHYERETKLTYPAVALGIITVLQMSLGVGAFIYRVMIPERIQPQLGKIFFVTAHQSLGALLLAISVFLALRAYRMSNKL